MAAGRLVNLARQRIVRQHLEASYLKPRLESVSLATVPEGVGVDHAFTIVTLHWTVGVVEAQMDVEVVIFT